MSAVTTRSICWVMRRTACSTATNKSLVTYGFLRHSHTTSVSERVTALLRDIAGPRDPDVTNSSPLSPDWKPPVLDWNAPRDILIRANAGTGETSAYFILAIESRLGSVKQHAKHPVVNPGLENSSYIKEDVRLAHRRRSASPLILAPTRESAIQIARDAQKLTIHQRDFQVQLLVGGSGMAQQMEEWTQSSRDLVVATPGRLRDLLTNEAEFRRGFKDCPMLILDQTDTLLSMGFRDDIDAIVSFLPRPPVRQTLLFSATMSRAVRQLASWILSSNHTFINAVPPEPDLTPGRNKEHTASTEFAVPCDTEHDRIEQFRTLCPTASDQLPTLLKLLAHDQLTHGSSSKVVVFCPTVQTAELFSTLLRSLADVLPDGTTEIQTMHSKMKQSERDRARLLLRRAAEPQTGRPSVQVSSNASERIVDHRGATRVIQIGIPSKETTYIHRIGRFSRAVDTFVPKNEKEDIRPIVRGDLLLLPWEAGYMDWHLTSLPITPLPISDLDSQLASLAARSSALTTKSLSPVLTEIQRRIDPAEVRSAAASLLGYYLPLTPALRLRPSDILAGVSSWTSECFNVLIPPIKRFPRKFTEAYEQSTRSDKTKGLFVDGLKIAGPSPLGKAKSKNRSVWEGVDTRRKKPKRWY